MFRRIHVPILLCLFAIAACSSSGDWSYVDLADIAVGKNAPRATDCVMCHEEQYEMWKKTDHADAALMNKISITELQECGACHDSLAAHIVAPMESVPPDIEAMDKSGQNMVCGKCHFNKTVLARRAINPHNWHGLLTNSGFEGKKKQLSCLDCHAGHAGKRNMLQGTQAHTCFKCHKSAIVTMGIFQPLNYLAFGKVCTSCHAAHGTSRAGHAGRMTVGVAAICVVCHIP